MGGYIDFHAHILPGADHGSGSLDTSLFQLKSAAESGVGYIVATPHFYPNASEARGFIPARDRAYAELIKGYSGGIRILMGAEVFLCEGLQNYPELHGLCIEGTSTILIEMPNPPWPKRFEETLFSITDRGYKIILAHIDRYPADDTLRMLGLGFRWQINAEGILHFLLRRRFTRYIEDGAICALGSDVHGKSDAYRHYAKAMDLLGVQGTLLQDRMCKILKIEGLII